MNLLPGDFLYGQNRRRLVFLEGVNELPGYRDFAFDQIVAEHVDKSLVGADQTFGGQKRCGVAVGQVLLLPDINEVGQLRDVADDFERRFFTMTRQEVFEFNVGVEALTISARLRLSPQPKTLLTLRVGIELGLTLRAFR